MLKIRENLKEVMTGGNPDRFVKQYEFMEMIMSVPFTRKKPPIGGEIVNEWGVTISWPEGQLGSFPVHDDEHIVIKDICDWKKYVKAPNLKYPDEAWETAIAQAAAVDRTEKYVTAFVAPGLFEHTHFLMRMENALMNFYEEPEAMHELIEYLTEFELNYAKEVIEHIHPDALFHHDDWGSQISTFLSPAMFEEFFVPAYKKIYGYWKDNGVEIVVHHSDSYAETLVPYMIEMGIDIWQGVMTTNNIPEMIEKYGNHITFMGGVHSGVVDKPDWTKEEINDEFSKVCKEYGKLHFIPGLSQGLGISSFSGVYEAANDAIDIMSKELF